MSEGSEINQGKLSKKDLEMARRRGFDSEQLTQREALNKAIIAGGGKLETPYRTDDFLENLRGRDNTPQERPNIHDLALYFQARRDDTPKRFKEEYNRFNELHLAIIDTESGNQPGEDQKVAILKEIEGEMKDWRIQSMDEHLPKDARQIAAENANVFAQLRDAFYQQTNPEKVHDTKADQPMSKEESEALMKEMLPSPDEFTQYDIVRDNTKTAVEAIPKAESEITIDQIKDYYIALAKDAAATEGNYEETFKWRVKREVVQKAAQFNHDHAEDPVRGLIYISVGPDGSVLNVGWETPSDIDNATLYTLDPNGYFDPTDPERNDRKGLDYQGYNVDQFDILLKDSLPPALEALKKVKRNKSITDQEQLYMNQLIERFAGDKSTEMQAFINSNVKIKHPSRMRRMFTKAGRVLKGKPK